MNIPKSFREYFDNRVVERRKLFSELVHELPQIRK